jgi:hypothetical protein
MSSRRPVGRTWRDSHVAAPTCRCTASRATSSSSRLISSRITATFSPTASRTASHETRRPTASCRSSSSARTRWRNRCARSAGASRCRQRWQARRCRSRWQSARLQTCCRSPARGCGRNQCRQIRHGRLRPMWSSETNRRTGPLEPDQVNGGAILASRGGSILASVEVPRMSAAALVCLMPRSRSGPFTRTTVNATANGNAAVPSKPIAKPTQRAREEGELFLVEIEAAPNRLI